MANAKLLIWTQSQEPTDWITGLLQIPTELKDWEQVISENGQWCYYINLDLMDEYLDYMAHYMDILEPKLKELNALGIKSNQITIWFEDKNKSQNNYEFYSYNLLRMGRSEINFCLSIY